MTREGLKLGSYRGGGGLRAALFGLDYIREEPAHVSLVGTEPVPQHALGTGYRSPHPWAANTWQAFCRRDAVALATCGAAICSIAVQGRWALEWEAEGQATPPPMWHFTLPASVPWPAPGGTMQIWSVETSQCWPLAALRFYVHPPPRADLFPLPHPSLCSSSPAHLTVPASGHQSPRVSPRAFIVPWRSLCGTHGSTRSDFA